MPFPNVAAEDCGYAYDHDLPALAADEYRDGFAFVECRTCGAEIEVTAAEVSA